MPLFLDAPNLGEREKAKLIECVDSTYVSTAGPFVHEFEESFASFLGVETAVSVQSGTAAIHIALVELGIGPGDEVIVPALSFVASVNPVLYAGATPVFVDVDPMTWTLDPDRTEREITGRTRAILPVHLYGNPCDMGYIQEMAEKHGIAIVEDATESLGAVWKGRFTGTIGDLGCFSFNGNKLITTGGGGMLVARDRKRADHIRFLVNQARDASKGYFHEELGYNYRMTNLEASLGLAQMERLEEFLEKKRRFSRIYREELEDLEGVRFQKELPQGNSSWWLPSLTVERNNFEIRRLQVELKSWGIPTRRLFGPMVDYPYLGSFVKHDDFAAARRLFETGINLPASTLNSEEETALAARTIREVILRYKGLPG